ncbi:hypothetical protein DICVIV_09103 [Dictyocaulus viviparus]|uniref:Uncharacterized protein n=1 Tax=Dictyocaulus viviparus TaxID=29172 RepID=A0A0D8XJU8_DICVI|nr:hypothetical protein DICVIV_09103 [Dictyocaulus viviparus]
MDDPSSRSVRVPNRFGQSAYRSAFNTVPHECSSTIDERDMVLLSAPAPAPMHHRVSSVELGEYGYPSKSARRLTRLYKSVDTMELEPETNVKSNENLLVVPTNCSIRQNPDVKELYHAQSTNASSTIRKFHGDHTRSIQPKACIRTNGKAVVFEKLSLENCVTFEPNKASCVGFDQW